MRKEELLMTSETKINLSEILKGKEEISPNLPGLISLIEDQTYVLRGDEDTEQEQENDFLDELLADPIAEKLFRTVITVQYPVAEVILQINSGFYGIEEYIRKLENSKLVFARKSKFISVVLPSGDGKTRVLIWK